MLQVPHCRSRQKRLLDVMQSRGLGAVVVGQPRHVYYFTAYLPFWLHEAAFVLHADGRSALVCGKEPESDVAADDVTAFESNWFGTQRQEQPAVVASQLAGWWKSGDWQRVAFDASPVCAALEHVTGGAEQTIDEDLWQLRRRKDPDELGLMKKAIACTRAMHERASQIIEPGIPELRVFAELHAAAVQEAGEPLYPQHLGNDYACGVPGGPPRAGHTAQPGQLYILDLGPAYRGYFSDNSRAISVDRRPTDPQMEAWHVVADVFPIVERMVRPGVKCREIFRAVDEHYRSRTGSGFPHHLGHGVGLQPHEFPHLNPKWDDTLQEGEVFTAEPGLYGPHLGGGMRIENQYLVTRDGVENLTPFPMGLA
jgi:Xaa-Pro aminopeptidase